MKVVINKCYGGFSLSRRAVLLARELSGNPEWGGPTIKGDVYSDGTVCDENYGSLRGVERNDPTLVAVVEKLGSAAGGRYASLKVVEIPDGVSFRVEEYDGQEWIAEDHRTWS